MQIIFDSDDVTIRDVPPTPVAIMEHRGDRAALGDTIQRFRAGRKAAGLSPEASPTFMVFRSERCPAIPADYSMDLCVGTDLPIDASDDQMKAGVIPGGRCAVLRYPGNTNNLEPAALYLYRVWLPASGEEARDFPIYCQCRLSFVPDVPVHEVVEVFLPCPRRRLVPFFMRELPSSQHPQGFRWRVVGNLRRVRSAPIV